MDELSSADVLTHRLVVERLGAPGVLDRSTLQRRHDRFASGASAHILPRLNRRLETTTSTGESLPLVRIAREESSAPFATANRESPRTFVGDTLFRSAQYPSETGNAFVGGVPGRPTQTMTNANEFVARRPASSHEPVSNARLATHLLARAEHRPATPSTPVPPILARAAATSVIQRVVDAGNRARVAAPTTATPSTSKDVVHQEPTLAANGTRVVAELPLVSERSKDASSSSIVREIAATTRVSETVPVTRGIRTSFAPAPAGLVLRKADSARRHVSDVGGVVASSLPIVPAAPVISAGTPPQLLMRKPDVARTTTPPTSTAAPSSSPSPAATVSTTTAHQPSRAEAVSRHAAEAHIEWIAEQVGSRLARRLEIERERMGVRRWRQVS